MCLNEKILMLGGIGGRRRRGRQRLDGIADWMDVSLSELRELVMDREAWRAAMQRVGHDWATELNWTELKQFLESVLKTFRCQVWASEYKIKRWVNESSTMHFHLLHMPFSCVEAKDDFVKIIH